MGSVKRVVLFVLLGMASQVQSSINISVFSTTSKTAILRWTRVNGATSYRITATPTGTVSPIAFAEFGPNTVLGSINSLSVNSAYTFAIEAVGTAERTAIVSNTAPGMMDLIEHIKSKDSRTLMVEFPLTTGATNYHIRVQNNMGSFAETTATSSPAEIQSLSPYTDYTISIMAENSGGRSQPSVPVGIKTVLPPPQPTTSSPSNDSIVVSWAPVNFAVKYTLMVVKFDSSSNSMQNVTDTNVTLHGLDAGSLYMIQALAWDPEGRQGERSPYVNQTTRPPSPSGVNVSMVTLNGVGEVSVSWQLEQGVYGTIDYLVTSDSNLTCNTTSNSCSLSPVACGEVHTIQVTASNDAGPSIPSNSVVFITIPCPPESLALADTEAGNCTLTWDTVSNADSYMAFIKRGDGGEEMCNTTSNNCTFQCLCGYTFLLSVHAINQAGLSPEGEVLNHTALPCCPADVSVSLVSTETLEITWQAARGAELYQTRAVDNSEVILCNDTAPVCALSDLSCDSSYSVVVTPCNEISGCNHACTSHTKDTAPCMPTNLVVNLKNSSSITVTWTASNRAANYTVSALGDGVTYSCTSTANSCDLADLSCGHTYDVSVTATSAAGQSLPSYTDSVETAPCCPANLRVDQVTQAMTNVSWSHAKGANTFITSLTSSKGHARCHTQDSHCLMGCITCGTNYTVTMEAFSRTGQMANCSYQGFSSSACCPSGVKLYRLGGNNTMRVFWRTSSSNHSYVAELKSVQANYTCNPLPGESSCDVENVQCGQVYHVVVAPLTPEGAKVQFCPLRMYSVSCLGSNIGMVFYRGKRSVD
ncbi:fibronectin type III domain-containing protein 7-like [Genypterus blacodes]|uniref:fibronectin type III domain-containing protein 7-like n=1 Tax=Genypterus blacodes TaxID=154954 RepID=UPI003F76B31C